MSYHIINIDSPKCSISCSQQQLICTLSDGKLHQLPLEDVAAIVITSFSAHLHSKLLLEAAKMGVALILCEAFQPVSILLPANRSSDTLLTKATVVLPKKVSEGLWRKTIDAKCVNQSLLAECLAPTHKSLEALQRTAKGKYQNKESTCARYFWRIFSDQWTGFDFKRDQQGGGINALLNYGYAILLSIVLQKLFAVGLDPTFGIGHEIRERSTPLAYDIMEPFRPVIDWKVYQWTKDMENPDKAEITGIFRRYLTQSTLEKVGYLGIEMTLIHCVENVVRTFRKAVMSQQVRPYKPWTPSNSKWVGSL